MLEIDALTIRYGKHLAVDGISLNVAKGETVVLLGANGAGKSSLLKAVGGMVAPASGDVRVNGSSLAAVPAHQIVERGVALVPEGRGIFAALTVEDNLRLGANPCHARSAEKATREHIFTLFPRLAERRQQLAGTMSGGEQQMVAIGRALMSAPDYLLLDEPSLGLAPIVTQELFAALAEIKKSGLSILLVEQNVRESLALADRGYLLEAGRIVGAGTAQALSADPAVQRAFLGGTTAAIV
ncbi:MULTISPECIES: ABC transporter ATP-binding protein [Rhizobium/Agrobacterium group]|uniref:ABC transporter ATP-binding protein n=1 Tax=Rhizobium rhizogenes TaxID=359 RepID=A0A546XEB7_RHIRH|nr:MULTISPECIES: ABC transporter ATP-binding protein [Rhizobium/Agrobacterium group]MDO3444574.1 ABC transporter ATP-binding protein [Agrobacterium sp. V1]TRA99095.1 ABC transporter ATP-binding protein [Rhizobium rhizogenes]